MLKGSKNVVAAVLTIITVSTTAVIWYLTDIQRPVAAVVLGVGLLLAASPRIINEWERGVLLRLGKFQRVLKPGICWVVPFFDVIANLVDMRIRSTSFSAEKTLTKDTVPVNVDAVLFWVVTDAKQAILEVETYRTTVSWAAQTTLRDVIGKTQLVGMISDRQALDEELQRIIDAKTSEWGVTVQSVEIRDVRIPGELEDSMSRKAQADREREARVILAESERMVAEEMQKAANIYNQNKVALQIRAMNMTYEAIKEKGALMVIPSGMADSINPGTIGLSALAFERGGADENQGS